MNRSRLLQWIVAFSLFALASDAVAFSSWTQRGGPKQDFKVTGKGLAMEWPDQGPPKLWSRDLGEGYSGILYKKGRLYTMYRDGDQEVVIALDAKNGETLWEHKYDASIHEKHDKRFGAGPRSTALLSGKRLFTIGCSGKMHCLRAKTGKVYWSKDLWKDFGGTFLNHGYSSSPFAYKKNVIVMVGGKGHGLVAFNKKTGEEAWRRLDFDNSYSTPKLIKVEGQTQLLCFMAKEIAAVDPRNGELLWSYPHQNQWKQNISMPVWSGEDNILFISSPRDGSRGLKLTRNGEKTEVKQLWQNKKLGIHHSNGIRVDDHVYTVTGGFRPGLFQAIDVKTGKITLRERGLKKANCLYADGRFLILDEDGTLALVTATPEVFELHAKATLLEPVGQSKAWTAPTLVGTTAYLRDSKRIMAVDLGAPDEQVGLAPTEEEAAPARP